MLNTNPLAHKRYDFTCVSQHKSTFEILSTIRDELLWLIPQDLARETLQKLLKALRYSQMKWCEFHWHLAKRSVLDNDTLTLASCWANNSTLFWRLSSTLRRRFSLPVFKCFGPPWRIQVVPLSLKKKCRKCSTPTYHQSSVANELIWSALYLTNCYNTGKNIIQAAWNPKLAWKFAMTLEN